jgi:Holliday junction resolvase RusA-like endonuclease
VSFEIRGEPVPQGSHRVVRNRIIDDNPKLEKWRERATEVARRAMDGCPPIDGPVCVWVVFQFPRPKSSKRHPRLKDTKPDTDKLLRALGDALEKAGVVVNDSRISDWVVKKRYTDLEPRTDVWVEVIE